MHLYLMQHGVAMTKAENAERPLSEVGIVQVRQAAAGIRQLLPGFDLIACSTKRRAQQTAALVAEAVRFPYSDILASESLLPEAGPEEVLDLLEREDAGSRILLVGHQPCLGRLASHFLQGGELRLENAGLAAFTTSPSGQPPVLDFLLTAGHLARLGATRSSPS